MSIEEHYSEKLRTHEVWHLISRNPRATSCQDAANMRWRLGQKGIPIFDELKSNFGCIYDQYLKKELIIVHCRGNQTICFDKLSKHLGSQFKRLNQNDLADFNIEYGTVNPFIGFDYPIRQIFDESVLLLPHPPGTMMTNLGNHKIGIEFFPNELISALPNTEVMNITTKSYEKSRQPCIGILTGNGPESGILLWERINEKIRETSNLSNLGDLGFPKIILESIPSMGLSMELDSRHVKVREVVLSGIRGLCEQGATIIGIACNTTQIFSEEATELCKSYGVQYVSMYNLIENALSEAGIEELNFLGIGHVSDFDNWSAFKRLTTKFKVQLPSFEQSKTIDEYAFSVKRDPITAKTINKFRDIVRANSSTKTVVLALTELSIIHRKRKPHSDVQYFDSLLILANEMARLYTDYYRKLLSL